VRFFFDSIKFKKVNTHAEFARELISEYTNKLAQSLNMLINLVVNRYGLDTHVRDIHEQDDTAIRRV
jgi:hypothetical protein